MVFIPTDPAFQPTRAAADEAVKLFQSIAPQAHEIEAVFFDDIEFHHSFQNWDGVECTACGADLQDWFFGMFPKVDPSDRAAGLPVTTPCCGLKTSMNDLDFGWGAGFARFALEVLRPGFRDTSEDQDRALAACLGCNLRKFWRHI
jgi:hypothetical protein